MIRHDVKQGSPEWAKLRLGVPTASEFDALITPKAEMRVGQGPTTYLYKKLCERSLGFAMDGGSSFAMGNGTILEQEALPWFEFAHEIKVDRVGFCTTDDGRIGASPDGLIGDEGGIEIKCPNPETHLAWLMEKSLPKEHFAQVHGSMLVSGRKWWNFLSYSRQFPAFLLRVERDERVIGAMQHTLDHFLKQFDAKLSEIQAMRDAENAIKNTAYAAQNP